MVIKKGIVLNDDSALSINPSPAQKDFMDKITNQINSYKFQVKDDEDDDLKKLTIVNFTAQILLRKQNFLLQTASLSYI